MPTNSELSEQILRIKEKFSRLKSLDKNLKTFGSRLHKFELNEPLDLGTISIFEEKYHIKLPPEYSLFLQQIGNGGAGPAYGLVKLENSLFADMDNPKEENLVDPAQPFPHTEPQIMMTEDDEDEFDDDEFDDEIDEKWNEPQHNFGILRLCNLGCGIFTSLVVNGQEYGNMWIDDRSSEAGIYPYCKTNDFSERVNFLDWYEIWLDQSTTMLMPKKK